jgi:alpha-glucosidase
MSLDPSPRESTVPEPGEGGRAVEPAWWRDGVLYQIYPRSFADSNRDGVGDLRGVVERLDHLEWLGVDGIWLNPTMPSPNEDWGYDVSDYMDVHPDLGTLEDLDALIAEAGRRGIRVLLDLVPNHTSDRHPWFQDALSGPNARHRDYYVWATRRPEAGRRTTGSPTSAARRGRSTSRAGSTTSASSCPPSPTSTGGTGRCGTPSTRSCASGSSARGRLPHRCLPRDHQGLRAARRSRGDGRGPPEIQARGLRQVYSMNRPELHDVLKHWRGVAGAEEPERVLVGETYVLDLEQLFPFYGNGQDELHLAFNFLFVHADLDAEQMRTVVEGVEAMLPAGSWPVYTGSNHDAGRFASRWAGGDERKARAALLMLLALRGTPFLYYGDEIAMPEPPLDPAKALDPVTHRTGDPADNRDPCRTPMQWSDEPGAGFTDAGAEAWLPLGDPAASNVAGQREDRGSVLHLVRDLIALRRVRADLRGGGYETLPAPAGAWAWRRGDGTAAAVNLSDADVKVDGLEGTVLVATDAGATASASTGPCGSAPGRAPSSRHDRRRAVRAAGARGLAVRLDAAGRAGRPRALPRPVRA